MDFNSLSSLFIELFDSSENPGNVRVPRQRGYSAVMKTPCLQGDRSELNIWIQTGYWMDGLRAGF